MKKLIFIILGILILLGAGFLVTNLLTSRSPEIVPPTSRGGENGLIAVSYQDKNGRYQIFAVSPDGKTRSQLTNDGNGNVMPKWSPDGKKIAYVSQAQVQNSAQIHIMDADGKNNRVITEAKSGSVNVLPDWSPDGSKIAYAAGTQTAAMQRDLVSGKKDPIAVMKLKIWVMNADGTGKKQITTGESGDAVPSWSPDGKSIVFSSNREGGKFRIWRMNPDGTNLKALTDSAYDNDIGAPVEQKVPAVSPDGKYIAYWQGVEMFELSDPKGLQTGKATPTTRDREITESWHIWRMNFDGTNKQMLVVGDDPAWSPDSQTVIFPTAPPGLGSDGTVSAINIDGTDRRVLFTTTGGPQRFSWQAKSISSPPTATSSPTSSAVISTADYEKQNNLLLLDDSQPSQIGSGSQSIYVTRPDGTEKTLLTNNGMMPSWTPDGKIIFSSSRSGSQQIWIMDADGSNAHQIGNLPANIMTLMPQIGRNNLVVFMGRDADVINDGNAGIWIMQKDGSGLKQLARGQQPFLAFSGKWIAYTFETVNPYHREIWRINTDGTGKKQLTFLGDPDYPDANAPSISPDEKTVAFFSGKESDRGAAGLTQSVFTWGYRNVAVIPADGGERQTLTPCRPVTTQRELETTTNCITADNPAWTPDSKWLIFDAGFKTGTETWMVDINGGNFQRFYPGSRGTVRVPLSNVKVQP